MAYDDSKMRLVGGVPGQQLFLYRSADAKATVMASGYFNDAVVEYNLSAGDVVVAVCGEAGSESVVALVAKVAAGVVTTEAEAAT